MAIGTNTIPIAVAEYVRGNGWKRQIDSIDKTILQKTVGKVAVAVMGSNLGLTKNKKDRTDKPVVQYALGKQSKIGVLILYSSTPHPSPEDPRVHTTITGEDKAGKEVFRKHVPYDPSTDAVSVSTCVWP